MVDNDEVSYLQKQFFINQQQPEPVFRLAFHLHCIFTVIFGSFVVQFLIIHERWYIALVYFPVLIPAARN